MSKRIFNFICGICALGLGGMLYVLFREQTIIAKLLGQISFITILRSASAPLSNEFVQYYLPDFLWAFSLGSLLKVIPGLHKKSLACGTIALICGGLWEIMQCIGVISGTFDWIDVLMYFLAGFVCVSIK